MYKILKKFILKVYFKNDPVRKTNHHNLMILSVPPFLPPAQLVCITWNEKNPGPCIHFDVVLTTLLRDISYLYFTDDRAGLSCQGPTPQTFQGMAFGLKNCDL